ncbi:MAG: Uma2 family endonuclease [Bacteroidetes bacterium]|nr:Uma2 family endonuclease [Fibrella sp.]
MPELELELVTGRSKPNVAIFPKLIYDWEEDIIRYTQPPITAIEILSPTQAFDSLISKIRKIYFPAGVQSAWLIVHSIKAIHLFLPGKPVSIVTDGVVHDPACQVSLDIDAIFR